MKTGQKPAPGRSATMLDQVLAVCTQLPAGGKASRDYFAERARKIFQASVSGVLVKENGGYRLSALALAQGEEPGESSLLDHVKSFAAQSVESKRLLNFSFSYQDSDGEKLYCGLAHPLLTSQSSGSILVARCTAFSPDEVSVFRVLARSEE